MNQNEIPVDFSYKRAQLALIMSLTSMKILTNMAHLLYHPRYCHIKATLQLWWIYWINWLSYLVNKDDGNRQTERQTNRETDEQTDRHRWQQPFGQRGRRLKRHAHDCPCVSKETLMYLDEFSPLGLICNTVQDNATPKLSWKLLNQSEIPADLSC